MPGPLSILSVTVMAESGVENQAPETPLNRDELSLYTVSVQKRASPDLGASPLEESVAAVRRAVEPYAESCQGFYDQIKPKVQTAAQLANATFSSLKNPPEDLYPRLAVIGFTGILGLFLARGSRVKRLVYPAGLMAVSASLYFPERAAAIARSTGDTVYDRAVQVYVAVERKVNPPAEADKTKP